MRKIGFSTGALYSWGLDLNEQIKLLSELNLDAVELSFINIDELKCELSPESIAYLKTIPYVSIHAPIFNANREKLSICDYPVKLTKLCVMAKKIDAKSVVFHPDTINDWEDFSQWDMPIAIENLPAEDNYDNTKLIEIFKQYPHFKMILDTAHAFSCSENQYVEVFADKITHIHLSDRRFNSEKGKLRDHETFYGCNEKSKFDSLKKLDCTLMIEISIKDKKGDLENIKNEIQTVREYFKGENNE